MIKEIEVKTAIHYHKSEYASNWDLNIYRGCSHKCKYCFAQYSHQYLDNNNFYNDIYVKKNIANILDIELSKKNWKRTNLIQISGVTDCYQPIEEKYCLMRDILKVLIKHKQSVFILTKSPLIYRDYDLIKELSEKTFVNIAFTITSLNENIRQKIEPNVKPSIERLKILKEFSKLNCKTTIMFMPIIPYLTDSKINIENIFKVASRVNCDYIIYAILNLKGICKINFYDFLKKTFPNVYNKIKDLYLNNYYVKSEYENNLESFVSKMFLKYNLKSFNNFSNDFYEFKKKVNNELF